MTTFVMTKIMIYKDLENIGLTENEAKIYLAILELGETTISRISEKAGIKRTTVYLSLDNLKKQGLVSLIKKRNKKFFYAENPRILEDLARKRSEKISEMIPGLLAISNVLDKKPEIRYFEGKKGIEDVLRDTLNYSGQEICVWYSESYAKDFSEEFFTDFYIKERVRRKILTRAILPDHPIIIKLIKNNQNHLRKVKLFPRESYDIDIQFMLYGGNQVAMISFKEEFSFIIESVNIHKSLKSIFEIMWNFQEETY